MNRSILLSAVPIAVTFVLFAVGGYLTLGASGGEFFMPHAHCYLFNQKLMALHECSDFLIGSAYVAISATLVWLVYRARRELPFHWMMIAFAIFIVACGATHFMEVWTLTAEHPRYWLAGWVKLVTAVASVTTAIFLPLLVPRILGLMAAARISAERGQKLERAYGELNALYAKVTQLDQLKTNFFTNVSHELRTPLTLIFAPIERLLQTASDPATQRELTVVRRNALLLHKHVNDLLDVSKLEMSKMELHYSRLDVAAMARAMAGIFDSVIGERGVQVVIETPAEAIAEVDGDKIQRVFMNLLSNAFKYAPEHSAVRLTLTEEGDDLLLIVEDAGPGVPPELRSKIFERFQQGDRETQRRYGGTGLGLSIVREFVEMHLGTISLGEGKSGGAQFRVHLPRHAPRGVEIHASPWATSDGVVERLSATHATRQPSPVAPAFEANGESRPDVLVVEDNRDMRELICRVLEPEARTRTAENGRTALDEMRRRVPDLVLMDLMMPVMTGDEMLGAMRQDERMRDVPVILLTAKADEDMKLNLLTSGAQDYVMKPFSVDELRARVRNQLQTKLTRDTLRHALDSSSEDLSAMVRELAAARTTAETANAAKDDFLAVLSHELRTPLTPALAATSALMDAPVTDAAEASEFLAIIRRNIELEARLVDDLLDVTRIARGKLHIQSKPVDLYTILRDALANAEPVLREKGITSAVDLTSAGPSVRGDSARLTQVFSNLLTNAAKFTPEGGSVKIHSLMVDHEVSVEVADTGIGITSEMLPQVFDPFRQAETGMTRRFGGLGLGLSVARGLVEAHGGTIGVRSEGLNRGATFTVKLPVIAAEDVAGDTVGTSREPAAPARSLHVLLVEDHEDTRRILDHLISRWGHRVTTASSVAEARAILAQSTFDLLLSDIGLPDGSGLDVISALREKSNAPAIGMSGFGMETDVARTQAAGFAEHIIKPVAAEKLRETLTRLAGR